MRRDGHARGRLSADDRSALGLLSVNACIDDIEPWWNR
jgi:hypothetical protein